MTSFFVRTARSALAGLLLSAIAGAAQAQTKFEARYGIAFAGIPIGKGEWTVEIRPDAYTMTATGSASGLITALISGEGEIGARGTVRDGKLSPSHFTALLKRDDEKSETRMTLDNGQVKEIAPVIERVDKTRVPVSDAHRSGVTDPLSAMMIPATLDAQACQRTLSIFDGRRRFDLKLSFKRMDKVKADKGYSGPAVVCATEFRAIAGHRADSALAKYLTEGREIEIWLAPVAGTQSLAPFRLSIASMIGNMVIAATRFEATPALAKAP
jgi:hypothetical protein